MAKFGIILLTLSVTLPGLFASALPRADRIYALDYDYDLDSVVWSSDCYYSNVYTIGGPCLGPNPPAHNPNFGYWANCDIADPKPTCNITFRTPDGFTPESIFLESFIWGANIKISQNGGLVADVTRNSSDWIEDTFFLSNEANVVTLVIEGAVPSSTAALIEKITIVGFDGEISSTTRDPITHDPTFDPTLTPSPATTQGPTDNPDPSTVSPDPSTPNPGPGYHLDTINDIDAGDVWTTDCEKYQVKWEDFVDCLGINRPLSNDNEGYWTACEDFGSFADCRITFNYEAGFSPTSVSIKNFISGTGARIVISTPSNPQVSVITRDEVYNWMDDVVDLVPADVVNGTEIFIDIFNDFSNFYGIIVDQIEVS